MKFQRIRDLREDKDLKQKDIAKILYMNQNQYQRYESGVREPPIETIIQLSKYYNVSIDYILGLTNDKGGLHNNYINEEEKEIIEIWNSLSDKNKIIIKANMEALSDRKEKKEEKKSVG